MKFEKLIRELDTRLLKIKDEHSEIINQANFSITCKNVLSEMSYIVQKSGFKDEKEEVHLFFKMIKVQPLGKLIYFSEIHSLELKFPKVSVGYQKKHIKTKIKKINKFYDYDINFVQYVKEKNTHIDKLYFVRANNKALNYSNINYYFRIPEFSTSHDLKLGQLQGFDKLANYLQN